MSQNIQIQNLDAAQTYYHNEFDNCVKIMEKYKRELEAIRASRWWKIRCKIKGEKING